MESVLEELYYNNPKLAEKISGGEEYKKIHTEFCNLFEKLLESLNDEQKEMLNNTYELSCGLEAESGLAHFKEGFKLCMRLMVECMSEQK